VVPPAFADSFGLKLTLTGEPGSLTATMLCLAPAGTTGPSVSRRSGFRYLTDCLAPSGSSLISETTTGLRASSQIDLGGLYLRRRACQVRGNAGDFHATI